MGIKKLFGKTKERVVSFYEKHKAGISGAMLVLGSGAVLWTGYKMGIDHERKQANEMLDNLPEVQESEEPKSIQVDEEPWYEFYWKEGNFWVDGMQKRYDDVIDFAENLHLGDGEIFSIEGINPDLHPEGKDYLVMHAVDGQRSYPYEEEIAKKFIAYARTCTACQKNDILRRGTSSPSFFFATETSGLLKEWR